MGALHGVPSDHGSVLNDAAGSLQLRHSEQKLCKTVMD